MKLPFRQAIKNRYFWIVLKRWRWQWLGLAILTGTTLLVAILDDFVPFNLDLVLLILYGLVIPFSTIWVIMVFERTTPRDAPFAVNVPVAFPFFPAVRFGMSPACAPSGFRSPWCFPAGLKCPPADLKSGGSHLPTA